MKKKKCTKEEPNKKYEHKNMASMKIKKYGYKIKESMETKM